MGKEQVRQLLPQPQLRDSQPVMALRGSFLVYKIRIGSTEFVVKICNRHKVHDELPTSKIGQQS